MSRDDTGVFQLLFDINTVLDRMIFMPTRWQQLLGSPGPCTIVTCLRRISAPRVDLSKCLLCIQCSWKQKLLR